MQSNPRASRCAGFTLIELFVVLLVLAIGMGLGIPALHNFVLRSRTEGFAREASMLLQRSRLEAIQSNRQVAVFLDGEDLVAFVDADADGTFNPDPAKPFRTVDWVIGRLSLPGDGLAFKDPAGNEGEASIDGFTDFAGAQAAVFQPNGSVADEGAFRIADVRENFLELRIAPAATGRIEVRKWQQAAVPADPPPDGEVDHWIGSGDPAEPGYQPWKWN